MTRKQKLLQELVNLKCKLELRKKRFELWQEQLEDKHDAESIRKSSMFWQKERWLNDRITGIEFKIADLKTNLIVKILKGKMYA